MKPLIATLPLLFRGGGRGVVGGGKWGGGVPQNTTPLRLGLAAQDQVSRPSSEEEGETDPNRIYSKS